MIVGAIHWWPVLVNVSRMLLLLVTRNVKVGEFVLGIEIAIWTHLTIQFEKDLKLWQISYLLMQKETRLNVRTSEALLLWKKFNADTVEY